MSNEHSEDVVSGDQTIQSKVMNMMLKGRFTSPRHIPMDSVQVGKAVFDKENILCQPVFRAQDLLLSGELCYVPIHYWHFLNSKVKKRLAYIFSCPEQLNR